MPSDYEIHTILQIKQKVSRVDQVISQIPPQNNKVIKNRKHRHISPLHQLRKSS